MRANYSPQLMEEAVFRHLNYLERSGSRAEYDEYHSLSDPIYEVPEDDREVAFEKVNKAFFIERLKLGEHVLRALEAVGLIPKRRRAARRAQLVAVGAGSGEETSMSATESESDEATSQSHPEDEAVTPTEAHPNEDPESRDNDESDDGVVAYDLARDFEERIHEVTVKRAINKVDEGSNVLNRISGRPVIEMLVLAKCLLVLVSDCW